MVKKLTILLIFILLICYSIPVILLFYQSVRSRNPIKTKAEPFVSIIVAAHNECDSVLKCLETLCVQNYPRSKFEIIVVDDGSSDCTRERLELFSKKEPIIFLKNSNRQKYKSSKKAALELAISRARGDVLLFTDADCTAPKTWIKSMTGYFEKNTGLVAGFSPQIADKKLLHHILVIDAAAAAFVSAGTIAYGRGITCAGRNLAYRKEAFDNIGGFSDVPDSLSGDDDFILQAISKHSMWKIKYAADFSTLVPARGPENIKMFLHQKQRHISAGKYFPAKARVGFFLFHILNLFLWACMVLALLTTPVLLIPLLLKTAIDYMVLSRFLAQFKIKIEWKSFMIWEILFLYYNTIVGPIGLLKRTKW